MDVLAKLAAAAIVPVVALDRAEDAVPTARAMVAGGIRVMEITFRTDAAADAIRAVAAEVPEMLVGAGTVINLEQCRLAMDCGANFIVSPGYDEETVAWCVENDIPVTPGCATPTEIMMAKKHGLKVLKFFPANVYGGLKALKALSAPFPDTKFIPTGGVNNENLGEFLSAPFIHAVGGSWVVPRKEIAAGNFAQITRLCQEGRRAALGFELAHVGVNCDDAESSMRVAESLQAAFGFTVRPGNASNFAGDGVEVMKSVFLGANGHIAVHTNKIEAAVDELEGRGFALDMSTAKYKGSRLMTVYLKDEIGGFAVHLLQK